MYTTYFLIGFVTSFGWWSAGKIQKSIDEKVVEPPAIVKKHEGEKNDNTN